MALSDGTKEAIYLRKFLNELSDADLKSMRLLSDSKEAIKLAEILIFPRRAKHINIRHNFVREALNNNDVDIKFISTEDMASDVLSKPFPSPKHYKCLEALGIECTDKYFRLERLGTAYFATMSLFLYLFFVSFQTELRPRWPRVKVPASEPKAPCWRPNSNTEPPCNGPVEHKIIRMEPNVSRWCGAEA
ncbi:hypothetical protein AVEN_98906-1 [Araneus ventricosus]|uniref:Retrovirus-related Pol polyprotein from transposon TNT 1-94 n=1 Tax=Araneus ventricosus TaxID=182803 RepID=A0A4Y2FUW0_ARAVE|nr:hypothetical protein AVEN_98906-1 [Araneus ventricosus]